MKMACHSQNKKALQWLPNKDKHIILFEQFLLSCCYSYSIEMQPNKFPGLLFEFLFQKNEDIVSGAKCGYTHLIGVAKRSSDICNRLEEKVKSLCPEKYEKCMKLIKDNQLNCI
jgi:hypothetical protein